jgi:poly(hydroxyalkanoate) depolymerase family esterase
VLSNFKNLLTRVLALKPFLAVAPDNRTAALIETTEFGFNPGELQLFTFLPGSLPSKPPLVVVLHGSNQSAHDYAYGAGWMELAERCGFALLCPQQTRANNSIRSFNWFNPVDISRYGGEAHSIAEMIRHTVQTKNLDPRRVFITGLSSGAAMSTAMLATHPDLFVGGAVIAGLPFGAADTLTAALMAMMQGRDRSPQAWGDEVRSAAPMNGPWPQISIWHGTADRVVLPISGDELVEQWTNVHGIDRAPTLAKTPDGRTYKVWQAANGDAKVLFHAIQGMGHGTPLSSLGHEACGTAGPYLLDVGVNSTFEIAHAWGLAALRADNRVATPASVA